MFSLYIKKQLRKIMGLAALYVVAVVVAVHAAEPSQISAGRIGPTKYVTASQLKQAAPSPRTANEIRETPSVGGKDYTVSSSAQLKAAVAKLKAGDTLFLREGHYTAAAMRFARSGKPNAYITVQGIGNVVIDGKKLSKSTPVFDTMGQDYIRFKNLEVRNSRAAVQVSPGSHHIVVEKLVSRKNQFAVKASGGSHITIRDAKAYDSRNAFRFDRNSHDIAIDDVEAYGSKDVYPGYDKNYLNGDGFIFEDATWNISIKNTVSGNHWDAGFDIKGSNVLLENVKSYGNKNGLKLWGKNVTVVNARVHDNKSQRTTRGGWVDGNGLNMRQGNVRIYRSAFWNNQAVNIKVGTKKASVHIEDSTIGAGRKTMVVGGKLTHRNVQGL